MTRRKLAVFVEASIRLVQNDVVHCLHELVHPLTRRFLLAPNTGDLEPDAIFTDFSNAFRVIDSSSVFIQRPPSKQADYYSAKYHAHCVKIQALITADGECVHLSPVNCDSTHNKTAFDESQVVRFLTTFANDILERKVILPSFGDLGIRHTSPEAMLPYQKRPHQELSPEQVEFNRILIDNFFDGREMLFRTRHAEFRDSKCALRIITNETFSIVYTHNSTCPFRLFDGQAPFSEATERMAMSSPTAGQNRTATLEKSLNGREKVGE
jgi:hypothetical protein